MRTDGQIDKKKPKAASPSFANTPKIRTDEKNKKIY